MSQSVLNGEPHATTQRRVDDIDLREMVLAVWRRRFLVAGVTVVGALAALAYGFLAPKEYRSTALLVPMEAPNRDALSGAAALLGKKAPPGSDLDLYQALLRSRNVMRRLLVSPMVDGSDTGRGRTLPLFTIIGVDTSSSLEVAQAKEMLSDKIDVQETGTGSGGILSVTVSAGQPWLAQQIANAVVAIGQEELRVVKGERFVATLSRMETAADRAKAEWERAASALADYRDRNPSAYLPAQQLAIDRLVLERQVKEQKYLMARREVEASILEKGKAAPPTIVLDSADYPVRKSKPKRSLILVAGTALSFLLASMGAMAFAAFGEGGRRV